MIAIELLQTYLLIHDDWMDDDAVRRGGPSVHVALRERLGDRAMGDAGAILAGDLASAFAQSALLETRVLPERLLSAARTFARIQEEVVVGQLSEMRAVTPIGTFLAVNRS
jgi:geranylgeranyl diphosphate synthase type I